MSAYSDIMKRQGKSSGQKLKSPDRHEDRTSFVPTGTTTGATMPIGMKADGKKFGKRKNK